MSAARQILNQKIRDPTYDFKDVFLCLKQITNLNRKDWGNKIPSPLIVAVENLRQDLVVLMVRQFAVDVNSLDKIYSEGNDIRPRTALHRAVDMNNSAMVMQLLRLGADPLNIQAWSMLPHVGLVYGSALDNAVFARFYAVSKSIEYFIKKEQEKKQANVQSIRIIIGSPRSQQDSPTILIPEIREDKKRQSLTETFNDKVFEFFELNTEFRSIESRILGEKRPKMDQIKTMEAYMVQQRDRKNFIEYDDLKVLEQHLSEYLILQTDNKDKTTEEENANEKEEVNRIRQQLTQDLKSILQCSQCCQLAENVDSEKGRNLNDSTENKMYSCPQDHLICNTCLQNVKMSSDDQNLCPMCIQNESSNLRRNFLAEKLIEAFSELQYSSGRNNNNEILAS